MKPLTRTLGIVLLALGAAASLSFAAVVPREGTILDKQYQDPSLYVPEVHQRISELSPELAAQLRGELTAAGIAEDSGFYDVRAGRWSSLILRVPLLPGTGFANDLQWPQGTAPGDEGSLKERAWDAVRRYEPADVRRVRATNSLRLHWGRRPLLRLFGLRGRLLGRTD